MQRRAVGLRAGSGWMPIPRLYCSTRDGAARSARAAILILQGYLQLEEARYPRAALAATPQQSSRAGQSGTTRTPLLWFHVYSRLFRHFIFLAAAASAVPNTSLPVQGRFFLSKLIVGARSPSGARSSIAF